MSCCYGLIFCPPSLHPPPSFTHLFFQIYFSAHLRTTPFSDTQSSLPSPSSSSSPCPHLIRLPPLWGAARTIKGFVGELSPREHRLEPDQPPPEPQLASGTKYRERELRSWQSTEKTGAETDTKTEGRKINLDKNPQRLVTQRGRRKKRNQGGGMSRAWEHSRMCSPILTSAVDWGDLLWMAPAGLPMCALWPEAEKAQQQQQHTLVNTNITASARSQLWKTRPLFCSHGFYIRGSCFFIPKAELLMQWVE